MAAVPDARLLPIFGSLRRKMSGFQQIADLGTPFVVTPPGLLGSG
jgi:hypothetical protein